MTSIIKSFTFVALFSVFLVILAQRTEKPKVYAYTIPEICQMLIDIDKELVQKLQTKPKGEAEYVMSKVREYNDNLTSINERHKENWKRCINDTIFEAKLLMDYGGPQFLNLYGDRDTLEQSFGINNVSSRIMESQRQNTIDIWEDFARFYDSATNEKEDDDSTDKDETKKQRG